MHRILLLDDKSSTWHAVTGQPRATLRRLVSGRRVTVLIGQRRYCFCPRAAERDTGELSASRCKGRLWREPGEHVCSYLLVESQSKHGLNAPTKNPDLSLTFTSRAFQLLHCVTFPRRPNGPCVAQILFWVKSSAGRGVL